jgi:hypothetical protein
MNQDMRVLTQWLLEELELRHRQSKLFGQPAWIHVDFLRSVALAKAKEGGLSDRDAELLW